MAADGKPVETLFLVDTGADRTVFTSGVLEEIGLNAEQSDERIRGVGGMVNIVQVTAEIRMRRDGGDRASFTSHFWAVTDSSSLDLSVLGRDILGLFAVIVDRPGDTVCLVNQRHRYSIVAS